MYRYKYETAIAKNQFNSSWVLYIYISDMAAFVLFEFCIPNLQYQTVVIHRERYRMYNYIYIYVTDKMHWSH